MQVDEGVAKLYPRFEIVEQLYDGLGGKIIPWTKEHGGTSDDPSAQVLVVGADGEVVARAPDQTAYQGKALAKWLEETLAAYEREHPRTALPLVRADVTGEGEGARRQVACAALDAARAEGRPALLYFGRDAAPKEEKKLAKEVAAARKFEGKSLDSKAAAEAAEGFLLLRFDLGNEDHARLAADLGVTEAPTVLLVVPGEEAPVALGAPDAGKLRYHLKKHAPAGD